jgi:hypothetical protein
MKFSLPEVIRMISAAGKTGVLEVEGSRSAPLLHYRTRDGLPIRERMSRV